MTMDQLAGLVAPFIDSIKDASGPLFAILGVLLLTVALDFFSGVYAAWRSHTLNAKYLDAFIGDHIGAKVVPIFAAYLFSAGLGGVDTQAGLALGVTASSLLAAYEAATIASIMENFGAAGAQSGNVPASKEPAPVELTPLETQSTSTNLSDEDIDRIVDGVRGATTPKVG